MVDFEWKYIVHWPIFKRKTTNSKFKNSLCRIDHGHGQYRSLHTANHNRCNKCSGKFFAQTQYNKLNVYFVSVQHFKFGTIYRWSRSWYFSLALNSWKETEEAEKKSNQINWQHWIGTQNESNWKEEGKKSELCIQGLVFCSVSFSFRSKSKDEKKTIYFPPNSPVANYVDSFILFHLQAVFTSWLFSIPECASNKIIHQKMDTKKIPSQ